MVNKMDDERLMALAADSEDIRVEREHLREQLEVLKQGLQKCRRYGGRQSHGKKSPTLLFDPILMPVSTSNVVKPPELMDQGRVPRCADPGV